MSTASTTTNGSIVIGNPVQLGIASAGSLVTLSWPNTIADTILEGSSVLGPSPQWQWITNSPTAGPSMISLTLPTAGTEFLRVRRSW